MQTTIQALGHNYQKGVCTKCGKEEPQIAIEVKECEIRENMVTRILPETKVKDLIVETNANNVEIYNKNNELAGDNEILATGMKIRLELNGKYKEYILVVTGDLNGDGKMGNTDLLKMARVLVGLDRL